MSFCKAGNCFLYIFTNSAVRRPFCILKLMSTFTLEFLSVSLMMGTLALSRTWIILLKMVSMMRSGCSPWWCRCRQSSVQVKLFLKFSEVETPRDQPQQDRYHWNWFMSDLIKLWLFIIIHWNPTLTLVSQTNYYSYVKYIPDWLQFKWIKTTHYSDHSVLVRMQKSLLFRYQVGRGIRFRIKRER